MADTASSGDIAPAAEDREADANVNRYVEATLERHKQEGLELAVRARWIALAAVSVLLIFVVPTELAAWPLALIALMALNGYFLRRVGRVGRSGMELFLIFIDILLITIALLAPNPLSEQNWPTAVIYEFDSFLYLFVIVVVGGLSYSWRTIIALGHWMAFMYLGGTLLIWYYGIQIPEITQGLEQGLGFDLELAAQLDPNFVNWDAIAQEIVVLLIVCYTLALIVRRFNTLLVGSAELERERTNLSRYFSPNVIAELSQNDEPLKQIREQDVAVLFVDIVGFTAYAAARGAREVIETLREFQSAMGRQVFAHNGTLDKFTGDGLMATFGTPVAGPDDAANALACVQAMMVEVDRLNLHRRAEGQPEIDARFGVHFGPVVLGNIGEDRLEFAVIGNTVNLASRMEGLSRKLGARAVFSDDTVRAAGMTDRLRLAGAQDVRGAPDPIEVWVPDESAA